jgi:hypothetical protein
MVSVHRPAGNPAMELVERQPGGRAVSNVRDIPAGMWTCPCGNANATLFPTSTGRERLSNHWTKARDADADCREIFHRHYSRYI